MFKSYFFVYVSAALLLIMMSNVAGNEQPLSTVDYVDLERYLGLWYEIAKIPNRFQAQCLGNTTAEYVKINDSLIKVVNRCGTANKEDSIEGVAKVVNQQSNARLKVSFVRFLGKQWFWGKYWIIGLDDDYQWAVVGTPSRKFGWILCRTPEMTEQDLEHCYQILRDKGYNPADFVRTLQQQER